MKLELPELSLVVLVGPSGAGKSTFGARHFAPTEVVSSDVCRGLITDDQNDMAITAEAFDLVHTIVDKRLRAGKLVVVDATSVRAEDRRPLIALARKHHVLAVAIVLDLRPDVCHARNQERPDRSFGPHVVRRHSSALRRGLRGMRREGFHRVWKFSSAEEIDSIEIVRTRLWTDRRDEAGPFDVIGDVHGCYDEMIDLLRELGHGVTQVPGAPEGHVELELATDAEGRARRLFFVGDLVDRGPKTPAVLRFAMEQIAAGRALSVPGNHDVKLMRALKGRKVQRTHGLAESLEQLESEPEAFAEAARDFIDGLVSHLVVDDGRLVVAHAGIKEEMQGRSSGRARDFCLYGETTGEVDDFGLPVRHDWAAEYRGRAAVVYGHTPTPRPEWVNGTLCIDTGCVFGGELTALRWPERELVAVPARSTYYEPVRPLAPPVESGLSQQQHLDDMLHAEDVMGRRVVETRLMGRVSVRGENAAAALEVMSRFAADPRWIIHLPPTMAPCETSGEGDFLEHPDQAFAYFENLGVERVICERKHMGSRALVIVCRDEAVARERFGVATGETGAVLTRTGRRFFDVRETEDEVLARVRGAMDAEGLWEELGTDWVLLDAELMPWSTKAQALVRGQYAAVGCAGEAALAQAASEVQAAAARTGLGEAADLAARLSSRKDDMSAYRAAYRGYCWEVDGVEDLRLAPFHILASESGLHIDRDHLWHLGLAERLARHDAILTVTEHRVVPLDAAAERDAATDWWRAAVAEGSEGMVVKPFNFVARSSKGLIQPALKVRGPEYLRIIYGPHYLEPENLARLRRRGVGRKRSLALREFALGIEALERFCRREPLRRTHECVFALLALESEPVDPRL